ncbi:MAG: fumarylacetoacetate hydrolase family protein [Planctomycetaceae bacterium]
MCQTIPKPCRFLLPSDAIPRVGAADSDGRIHDLTAAGVPSLASLLDADDPMRAVGEAVDRSTTVHHPESVSLLAPVERQEIWAAGVTYLRSRSARMEESDFSATAYDRVYDADRPEIFFKSVGEKAVGHRGAVGIRGDASWSVPEPELALVMNARGRIVGVTIGNDMSSRDIEGENLLYLPQAKVYDRSCGLGPWILLMTDEREIRSWGATLTISRGGMTTFEGGTSLGNLKRSFEDLRGYLWKSQTFPHGVVLLTGTGIVPDAPFTLMAGDVVTIRIESIGTLEQSVLVV